jgi:hypothetical protein
MILQGRGDAARWKGRSQNPSNGLETGHRHGLR